MNERAQDEDGLARGVKANGSHPQGDADQNGKQQRYADQPQVLSRALKNTAFQTLRTRRLGPQMLRGNFCEAQVLNVGLRVHVDHGLRADRILQREQRLPFARMPLGKGFACHPNRLVHRKISAIVLEHPQAGFLDLRIGGIQVDQVHCAVIDRLIGEAVLHAVYVLRREMQMITCGHPLKAVLAIHEFVAECGTDTGLDARQIADGM